MEAHYTKQDFAELYNLRDKEELIPHERVQIAEGVVGLEINVEQVVDELNMMMKKRLARLKEKGFGNSISDMLNMARNHTSGCPECHQQYQMWTDRTACEYVEKVRGFRESMVKEGEETYPDKTLDEVFTEMRATIDTQFFGILEE